MIMRIHPNLPASLLLAVGLAGCATLFQTGSEPRPEPIAERGLAALERGEYEAAIADLEWVATHFPDRPAGRYALLALAAAELDPANPQRRPDAGAELLASFRAMEENPRWTVPLANTLRGVVLELREIEERARVAERAAARAERTARETAERARTAASETSRAQEQEAALRNRVAALERELARSRQQLAEMRGEVQRMRRALGG
jgi:hypothetical protein